MLLTKHEKRYKEYLATQKRYNEVIDELRKRPLIKLEEPYQHGWVLYLDLRDDIKNRKDYPYIKAAFELVTHSVTTRNVKLVKRIRSNKNFSTLVRESYMQGGKYRSYYLPELYLLSESRYKKLSADVSRWFSLDSYQEKWASFRGHSYWLDIPRYWIEVKVKPNIMTHRYEKGGKLEKEREELHDKLRDYWLEYGTNYQSSYPAYKDRAKTRAKIQKFKKGEIEDISIEKIPKEYDY